MSFLFDLFRQGWYLVQDLATARSCRWSHVQHTLYSMTARPGVKGKPSREKQAVVHFDSFAELLQTVSSVPLILSCFRGKMLDRCVLIHRLQYLCCVSPPLICVCPSLRAAKPFPHSRVWSLSNMFTFLILLHFSACIKFRAKFKDCWRCCLDHTVQNKSP